MADMVGEDGRAEACRKRDPAIVAGTALWRCWGVCLASTAAVSGPLAKSSAAAPAAPNRIVMRKRLMTSTSFAISNLEPSADAEHG
jgi:hypothetical protein